jgi:antitoxin VapB
MLDFSRFRTYHEQYYYEMKHASGKFRLLQPASLLTARFALTRDMPYLHWQIISVRGATLALNIKDPATEKCVRELASVTGETVTAAIRRAAEERLHRVRRRQGGRSLADEIMEIARRCAALPDQDPRTADEILGYDQHGLPR